MQSQIYIYIYMREFALQFYTKCDISFQGEKLKDRKKILSFRKHLFILGGNIGRNNNGGKFRKHS